MRSCKTFVGKLSTSSNIMTNGCCVLETAAPLFDFNFFEGEPSLFNGEDALFRGDPMLFRGEPWFLHGDPVIFRGDSIDFLGDFCGDPLLERGGVLSSVLSPTKSWEINVKKRAILKYFT